MHTVSQLEGITSITFKARVHGGVDHGNPWWGFGVNSYYDGDAIYQGMHTVSYDFDDEWHEYSISISSANGYVNFIQASGEFSSGSYIDLDDIVITYNGGAKLEETFDNGVILSLDDSFTKVLKY